MSGFDDTKLLGLCRLRIPDFEFTEKSHIPFHYLPVYRNKKERIARIRELHVYGNIASLTRDGNSQHRGIGTFLMHTAESIAQLFKCTLVTVISGVGVRDYYEHLGYTLDSNEDQYMVKSFTTSHKFSLTLFGKFYNQQSIHNAVHNSIISQKYIPRQPIQQQIDYTTHTYTNIQNGEAQGFAFKGQLKNYGSHPFAYLLYLPIVLLVLYYIFQ
jgi:hypothetical protein